MKTLNRRLKRLLKEKVHICKILSPHTVACPVALKGGGCGVYMEYCLYEWTAEGYRRKEGEPDENEL